MYDTARRTKDQMTFWTTSQTTDEGLRQTMSGTTPWAGVSFSSLKPKATSHKQIGRKTGRSQFYDFV